MSESTPKLSLATLPRKVLEQIILDPIREGLVSIEGVSVWNNGDPWLPIQPNMTRAYSVNDLETEIARPLRALAQTCQSLRAFVLPLLWAVLDLSSVEELGRVRDTLRATPSIAKFVRSFSIRWHMNGDFENLEPYGSKEDTLLDLAFRDRLSMFHELREKLGCEQGEGGQGAFFYEDERYPVLCDGPDGNGEDTRIKSAAEYNECLVEVVGRLTSLETFGWCTPCSPMPLEVCNALAKLSTLKTLHVLVSSDRSNVHDLPLWELSRNLVRLSFDFGWAPELREDVEVEEQTEESVNSVEAPPTAELETKEERDAYNLTIACRTVVAAAKGGHLRVLTASRFVQSPFAVRALLPLWVQLEPTEDQKYAFAWQGAALSLRALLWHVSRKLDTADKEAQEQRSTVDVDRHLTAQQLQSLQWRFVPEELPRIQVTPWPNDFPPQPVQRYLPWLAEDAELAQQVADAWNAVVERGEADKVKCPCEKCTGGAEAQVESEDTESRTGIELWAWALEKVLIDGMKG